MLNVILPARARGKILAALKRTRTAHSNVAFRAEVLHFVSFAHAAPSLRVVADFGQHFGPSFITLYERGGNRVTLTMVRNKTAAGFSTLGLESADAPGWLVWTKKLPANGAGSGSVTAVLLMNNGDTTQNISSTNLTGINGLRMGSCEPEVLFFIDFLIGVHWFSIQKPEN